MSLDEAVPIAIQIASALDAARRAGITHRDLKPGNRMLTKSGATLLDFGLAKQGAESAGGAWSNTGCCDRRPRRPLSARWG